MRSLTKNMRTGQIFMVLVTGRHILNLSTSNMSMVRKHYSVYIYIKYVMNYMLVTILTFNHVTCMLLISILDYNVRVHLYCKFQEYMNTIIKHGKRFEVKQCWNNGIMHLNKPKKSMFLRPWASTNVTSNTPPAISLSLCGKFKLDRWFKLWIMES